MGWASFAVILWGCLSRWYIIPLLRCISPKSCSHLSLMAHHLAYCLGCPFSLQFHWYFCEFMHEVTLRFGWGRTHTHIHSITLTLLSLELLRPESSSVHVCRGNLSLVFYVQVVCTTDTAYTTSSNVLQGIY